MPFQLDEYDVSILQALIKNGRKSFREISRDTGITTPTVKASLMFIYLKRWHSPFALNAAGGTLRAISMCV